MWTDILSDRVLQHDELRGALAFALGIAESKILVTQDISEVPPECAYPVIVECRRRAGSYPGHVSVFIADAAQPSSAEGRRIVGALSEKLGATLLASDEFLREDELLEIRGRQQLRIVDADIADED